MKRREKMINFYNILWGIGSVLSLYLGMCFSTITYLSDVYGVLHLICMIAMIGALTLWGKARKYDAQYQVGILCFALATGIHCISTLLFRIGQENLYILIGQILLLLWATAWGGYLVKKQRVRIDWRRYLSVDVVYLCLLCLISIALTFDKQMLQFRWDGALYYEAAHDASLFSFSSLALYGHQSQFAAAVMCYFRDVLGGNAEYGMIAGNLVIYMVGIVYFWKMARLLWLKYGRWCVYIGTALFAFSPYTLGMVDYYSVDFYLICFFPVVIYYTIQRKWLLQVGGGLLFCFTKEPAILIYGCVCLAVLLWDMRTYHKAEQLRGGELIKRIVFSAKYYGMLLCAALWLVSIKLLGAWAGGESSVGIDGAYVINKLKVLYVLNFQWLFAVLIVAGAIAAVVLGKRDRKAGANGSDLNVGAVGTIRAADTNMVGTDVNAYTSWIMSVALVGFTLFSLAFVTVNHARYIDIVPICLIVFVVEVACRVVSRKGLTKVKQACAGAVLSVLVILSFLSCFMTIDPISKTVFASVNTGNGTMISTGDSARNIADASMYNRQYLWLGEALDRAIVDAYARGNQVIFPMLGDSYYYVDGASGVEMVHGNGYIVTQEYWNPQIQIRQVLPTDGSVPLGIGNVANVDGLNAYETAANASEYAYIYYDACQEELSEYIREHREVISEKEYVYRGWKVYSICYR